MRHYVLLIAAVCLAWGGSELLSDAREVCKPTYAVLDERVKVLTGASELSFELLAVGCEGSLTKAWPPKIEKLEKALAIELREPHPVQTLFLIRDRSPELRRRITRTLNNVLGKPVVDDVFLFEARAAE